MTTRKEAENRILQKFLVHLGAYVAVVGGLAAMNLTRNPDNPWFLWVLGGWGLGVALHAAAAFAMPRAREKMIEKTQARMDERHTHA